MTCSRSGCDIIMCDTYVHGVGYVCTECKREFKNYLLVEGINVRNESGIKYELIRFMGKIKGKYENVDSFDIDEFFRQYERD